LLKTTIIWKQFKDTNYEVSNFGQVRNIKTKYILKPTLNKFGYIRLRLGHGKNKISVFVHVMVSEVFLGPRPDHWTKIAINHKDSNKENNALYNLEYCSPRENQLHSLNKNKKKHSEDKYNAKFSNDEVIKIRKRYEKGGVTQLQLAEEYGVAHSTMNYLINGRRNWGRVK